MLHLAQETPEVRLKEECETKNFTLKIDEESRDLVFDSDGNFALIEGDNTTAQAVRLTLEI